jgi:hypothetical protein
VSTEQIGIAVRSAALPAAELAREGQRPGSSTADPFIAALARYVEALHRRYPDGPAELRREGLDARAKVSRMVRIQKDPAA